MSSGKAEWDVDTSTLLSLVALVVAVALIAGLGILLKRQQDANSRRDSRDRESMCDFIHRASVIRSHGRL
jgi:hypothetical protein